MATMTPEEARAVLQVSASSSFEEVLAAKDRQLGRAGGDKEKAMEVDMAYDLLLMQVRTCCCCYCVARCGCVCLHMWRGCLA